jgi:adenosylcobinamide kinase/adenosylcobinamide-phosphate guanylyltransferase
MPSISLILGGARSGKSAYAERQAGQSGLPKIYIATAEILDDEMAERAALHRRQRGEGWATLEVPVAIAQTVQSEQYAGSVIVVDCLTLWVSNLMHRGLDVAQHSAQLTRALQSTQAQVYLVSSEVGQGIVPDNALARQFRDHVGMLHQRVAEVATRVVWMVAGLPTIIKGQ